MFRSASICACVFLLAGTGSCGRNEPELEVEVVNQSDLILKNIAIETAAQRRAVADLKPGERALLKFDPVASDNTFDVSALAGVEEVTVTDRVGYVDHTTSRYIITFHGSRGRLRIEATFVN